jgi:spermidine/putrescine transport system permease protein
VRKALGTYTALLLAALYLPIGALVAFSFNESRHPTAWTGFTLEWYRKAFGDARLLGELGNTLTLAAASTALSTVLGTLAALAARASFRGKKLYATLVTLPVLVPDIVLAIALLSLFRALGVPLSLGTAVVGHATFNLAYVALVVSARLEGLDRSVELAAQDLGATPWGAFWKVTFPAVAPGILAGAILAFTLSFDDFVVTYFTTGPGGATLPVRIYSMVRFGVTPEMNAVAAAILAVSFALIALALRISRVPAAGVGR